MLLAGEFLQCRLHVSDIRTEGAALPCPLLDGESYPLSVEVDTLQSGPEHLLTFLHTKKPESLEIQS